MYRWMAVATIFASSGCSPVKQPDSYRTAAAIEIPMKDATDKEALVAIFRKNADADGGLHVDDVSRRWQEFESHSTTVPPGQRSTIYVGVWRGANDDFPEADAGDSGHPGRTWLTFARGEDPKRSARFRDAVLGDVRNRWPDAKSLPIMPTGALPLVDDLRLTRDGYRIAASAAQRYELPHSSALIAPD